MGEVVVWSGTCYEGKLYFGYLSKINKNKNEKEREVVFFLFLVVPYGNHFICFVYSGAPSAWHLFI